MSQWKILSKSISMRLNREGNLMNKDVQGVVEGYELARKIYGDIGVDVDQALKLVDEVPMSIHCWQGDDVSGFENPERGLSGGTLVTGSYPGKARTPEELRKDMEFAFSLIPGIKRVNLHANYGESEGAPIERNNIQPIHFKNWVTWAKQLELGLDFNGTFYSHAMSDDGFTLSHVDAK